MALFDPANATRTHQHQRVHAAYSMAIVVINFLAAVMFVIGSILFFSPATDTQACWMFLIGSIFFAVSPTVALRREIRLDRD